MHHDDIVRLAGDIKNASRIVSRARDILLDNSLAGEADAVLAASIFHFGEYSIEQAKQHMASRGIEVRL